MEVTCQPETPILDYDVSKKILLCLSLYITGSMMKYMGTTLNIGT